MQTIRIGNAEFNGPSNWNELKAADLLCIGKVSSLRPVNEVSIFFLIVTLFHIPVKEFNKLRRFQKAQLKKTLDWLYKPNDLHTWLLASVKTDGIKLLGPASSLADLTAEEFMYCEGAYERWLMDDKDEHLDTLFAVLYRKKRFLLNKRQAFNIDNIEKNTKRAKNIKIFVKKAVATNYAGCRNLIISKHPYIWSKPENEGVASAPRCTNWAAMILDLAGDKFGTYEQTIKTNIWLLLADLNKKAKSAASAGGPKK